MYSKMFAAFKSVWIYSKNMNPAKEFEYVQKYQLIQTCLNMFKKHELFKNVWIYSTMAPHSEKVWIYSWTSKPW